MNGYPHLGDLAARLTNDAVGLCGATVTTGLGYADVHYGGETLRLCPLD